MSRQAVILITEAIADEEDQLREVPRQFQQFDTVPSPPTTNTFEFPSLLESLCDSSVVGAMPPADSWLEDDVDNIDDVFHSTNSDLGVTNSETITAGSSPDQAEPSNARYVTSENGEPEQFEEDPETITLPEPDSYSFESIIHEARLHYQDTKPDFCVKPPDNRVREVQLTNSCRRVNILFHDWQSDLGYWTYTDGIHDTYIIKWKNGRYHVWEGVDQGYSTQPVATPIKNVSRSSADISSMSSGSGARRERTARQLFPFSMCKAEKAYDKRGMKVSEAELEELVQEQRLSPRPMPTSNKRKHQEIRNVAHLQSHESTISMGSIDESDEAVLHNTMFRTRLHAFDKATIPIAATQCPSHNALFAAIRKKWAFQLHNRVISYCVVKFPWQSDDKNLVLQESDEDGFTEMVNEIRGSRLWQDQDKVEVVVEMFTEQSVC